MSVGAQKIVVLGMMTKMPVAGVVWQTVHYLVGLERLGYEVWYVEAHARTPSMLMEREADDSGALAAAFIDRVMRRFDLGGRWAYHALHCDGRFYGLSEGELARLYRSAALIINLHGGTKPLPEHYRTGRLVYVETDPVQLQVELHDSVQETLDFLAPHVAFFTFGENYARPDCLLPVSSQFDFRTTRQPVVIDFWANRARAPGELFTTIGNWRQDWRPVTFGGETYSWSKHREFAKFVELPRLTGGRFELALSSYGEDDRAFLERHGWVVRPGLGVSRELDDYRDYIASSRAEFTVAKDQNVRLRSGWFSDRSATYLAAGRPVITQETGFSNVLPTGEGLIGFSTLEEAAAGVEAVESDTRRHQVAAAGLAEDCFSARTVLTRFLAEVGMTPPGRARDRAAHPHHTPVNKESPMAERRSDHEPEDRSLTPGEAEGMAPISARLSAIDEALGALTALVHEQQRRADAAFAEVFQAIDATTTEPHATVALRSRLTAKLVPKLAPGAVAVVVSKGERYVRMAHVRTWDFPCGPDGKYRGFYPADDLATLAHLGSLRSAGARYFIVPAPSRWWLDHYPAMADHLARVAEVILDDEDGVVYDMDLEPQRPVDLAGVVGETRASLSRDPVLLDWTGLAIGGELRGETVFSPPQPGPTLPYADHTVDLVLIDDERQMPEAERVATVAVVLVARHGDRLEAGVSWSAVPDVTRPPMAIVLAGGSSSSFERHRLETLAGEAEQLAVDVYLAVPEGDGADVSQLVGVNVKAIPWAGSESFAQIVAAVAEDHGDGLVVALAAGVLLLPGSILATSRLFAQRPEVGAACGRVLDADGALLSAGGRETADGVVEWVGAHDTRPGRDEYGFARKLDALPADAYAFRSSLMSGPPPTKAASEAAVAAAARASGLILAYNPDCLAVRALPLVEALDA